MLRNAPPVAILSLTQGRTIGTDRPLKGKTTLPATVAAKTAFSVRLEYQSDVTWNTLSAGHGPVASGARFRYA